MSTFQEQYNQNTARLRPASRMGCTKAEHSPQGCGFPSLLNISPIPCSATPLLSHNALGRGSLREGVRTASLRFRGGFAG
ncbi:hypothetical protein MHYP_G00239370 [Metynnis hypsauchen]